MNVHLLTLRAFGAAAAMIAASPLVPAVAAAPTTFLEDSQSYALGNTFYAFRVPAVGSDGTTHYYDVTVKLGLSAAGAPNAAIVTSVTSPSVATGAVQPGTYKTNIGDTCLVTNMTLTNGRIQSFFECTTTRAAKVELSVASGPISAGHPYLAYLTSLGLNTLTDSATYTWGRVTNDPTVSGLAGCVVNDSYAIGAKSNGAQVVLAAYYPSKPAAFECGITLFHQ